MIQVKNYVLGKWQAGDGVETNLYNALNGDLIGNTSSKGLDFESILEYGRSTGGSILRKMTFQERGRMLKALALFLQEKNTVFLTAAPPPPRANRKIVESQFLAL